MKTISLIAILLTTACVQKSGQNALQENSPMDTAANKEQAGETKEEEVAGTLNLDQGNKWKANPETNDGIRNMQQEIEEHMKNGNTDIAGLSKNLEIEFSEIIQKCTMSGEAHTQLHNYLLPLRDRIHDLKKSKDKKDLQDMELYLKNYTNYFE